MSLQGELFEREILWERGIINKGEGVVSAVLTKMREVLKKPPPGDFYA